MDINASFILIYSLFIMTHLTWLFNNESQVWTGVYPFQRYLLALHDSNFKKLSENYVEVALFDLPTRKSFQNNQEPMKIRKCLKLEESGYLRANTIMKDLLRSVIQEDLLNTSGIQARKMNESFEFAIWEIGSTAWHNNWVIVDNHSESSTKLKAPSKW